MEGAEPPHAMALHPARAESHCRDWRACLYLRGSSSCLDPAEHCHLKIQTWMLLYPLLFQEKFEIQTLCEISLICQCWQLIQTFQTIRKLNMTPHLVSSPSPTPLISIWAIQATLFLRSSTMLKPTRILHSPPGHKTLFSVPFLVCRKKAFHLHDLS